MVHYFHRGNYFKPYVVYHNLKNFTKISRPNRFSNAPANLEAIIWSYILSDVIFFFNVQPPCLEPICTVPSWSWLWHAWRGSRGTTLVAAAVRNLCMQITGGSSSSEAICYRVMIMIMLLLHNLLWRGLFSVTECNIYGLCGVIVVDVRGK